MGREYWNNQLSSETLCSQNVKEVKEKETNTDINTQSILTHWNQQGGQKMDQRT